MENTGERRHWHFGHLLALAAICYFIPFVAVYLDEEVLETNWSQSLGGETNVIFQRVYGPFIDLENFLDRSD
jgi:hypothetical protein